MSYTLWPGSEDLRPSKMTQNPSNAAIAPDNLRLALNLAMGIFAMG